MNAAKPPPKRRSQEARADLSRAKILAAAERLFAKDGLAGARTDAIAAEAGVNKALLYYYFKSKERLYEAVLEAHLREFNERALSVLGAPGPAGQLLLQYVDMQFDFMSTRHRHAPLFQQFMSKGGKPPEKLVRKYLVPRADALRKLLMRGMRDGDVRRADPFHAAVSIASLIVFYFSTAPMMRMTGHPDPYDAASLARRKREVRDFIRHGLLTNTQD